MKINIKKTSEFFVLMLISILSLHGNIFAAKYTIASGIDFNTRIKMLIDEKNSSSSSDYTIKAFLQGDTYRDDVIDISEDGDSSVLAYIENDILYYLSDDDVYLNKDASYMFDKFLGIKRIDLSTINLTKTKNTSFMFSNCKSLVELNLDNDDVLKLDSMEGMFYNCESLVNLNIFMLNTRNVTDMSYVFANCINLKNIYIYPDLFKTNKATNFKNTYKNCKSLKTNLGKLATSIEESEYKMYTKAGDDEEPIEGLLRDYDYDYDIKDEKSNNYKTSLNKKIEDADTSKNKTDTIDEKMIMHAKEFSKVKLDKDSVFYNNEADDVVEDDYSEIDNSRKISEKGILRPDFSKNEEVTKTTEDKKEESFAHENEETNENAVDDKLIYLIVAIAFIAAIVAGTIIYSCRER